MSTRVWAPFVALGVAAWGGDELEERNRCSEKSNRGTLVVEFHFNVNNITDFDRGCGLVLVGEEDATMELASAEGCGVLVESRRKKAIRTIADISHFGFGIVRRREGGDARSDGGHGGSRCSNRESNYCGQSKSVAFNLCRIQII